LKGKKIPKYDFIKQTTQILENEVDNELFMDGFGDEGGGAYQRAKGHR
jgi:hypothetical protein